MKIRVTMKDPDALDNCVREAVLSDMNGTPALPRDEAEALFDVRYGKARKACSKWFEWGEYLTVEIDTEANTATVVPR